MLTYLKTLLGSSIVSLALALGLADAVRDIGMAANPQAASLWLRALAFWTAFSASIKRYYCGDPRCTRRRSPLATLLLKAYSWSARTRLPGGPEAQNPTTTPGRPRRSGKKKSSEAEEFRLQSSKLPN